MTTPHTTSEEPEPSPERTPEEIEKDIADLEHHSFTETGEDRTEVNTVWRWVVAFLALTMGIFHVATSPVFWGTLPDLRQGSFHVAMALALVFLIYPVKKRATKRQRWFGWGLTGAGVVILISLFAQGVIELYVVLPAFGVLALVQAARYIPGTLWGVPPGDIALSAAGAFCGMYVFVNYEEIVRSAGVINQTNIMVGTAGILLILAAAGRALGSALVILGSLMLAYAYYGPALPGFLHHRGSSVDWIVNSSYFSTEAIFGTPIQISAKVIFLFLIFAAMLQRTGMERFFTDLALGSTGWATGGTAKVGVATSAFSGTITGSSVANTVSNGAFTIPMMKKSGYKPEYAGAVEAASSTGGQIAPPIMGAAAFIMMEITGIPYSEILKAAIIPAILFFTAQFIVIHYDSKNMGISGVPKRLLPSVRRLMAAKGFLFIPIAAIFALLSMGFTPGLAAMASIGITIGINILAQAIAPAIAMLPRGTRSETAVAKDPAEGRLLGGLIMLVGLILVGTVAWLLFRGLGEVTTISSLNRVVLIGIGLGIVFAVVSQSIFRMRGLDGDEAVTASTAENVRRAWRAVIPFVVTVVVLALLVEVIDLLFPEADRSWVIVGFSVGAGLLMLPLLVAFRRWASEHEDKVSLASVADGLVATAKIALPIIVACATAGMVAGVITSSGLGLKLADGLVSLGGGYLIPVLAMSMLACLILGIGLPTTANYVVTATLAAPAIIVLLQEDLTMERQAVLLAAHMFVYYFGVMADITPPVCLAAYAASGISGGDPIRTGVQSVRIAISGFVVPYMFVISPQLLMQNVSLMDGIQAAVSALVGVFALGIAVVGFFQARVNWVSRAVLVVSGVLLLHFGWLTDLAGLGALVAVLAVHLTVERRRALPGTEPEPTAAVKVRK